MIWPILESELDSKTVDLLDILQETLDWASAISRPYTMQDDTHKSADTLSVLPLVFEHRSGSVSVVSLQQSVRALGVMLQGRYIILHYKIILIFVAQLLNLDRVEVYRSHTVRHTPSCGL
jgi:hypothetical protein